MPGVRKREQLQPFQHIVPTKKGLFDLSGTKGCSPLFECGRILPRTNLIWWRILPSLYFVRWLQFSCRCRNWVSFGAWSYYWIHWSKNSPSCPNSSSSPYWKSQESNRLADYLPIGFRQCPTIARTFPGSAFKVVYNIPNHSRKKLLSVNSYWDPVTAAGI